MNPQIPHNDLDNSRRRLDRFLSSRRLIFNPYSVSDRRLMDIVSRTGWGDEYDLVQAVVMNFTRLRHVKGIYEFDGIYATVGGYQGEVFIHTLTFTEGVTAYDSLRNEKSTIGKRRITNEKHIPPLVGKRVFVSRVIQGRAVRGFHRTSYRMTRITGNEKKDAAAVRTAMCEAKVEMLQRILEYPRHYLQCDKGFFDYEPRILRAIRIIESYSGTEIPQNQ